VILYEKSYVVTVPIYLSCPLACCGPTHPPWQGAMHRHQLNEIELRGRVLPPSEVLKAATVNCEELFMMKVKTGHSLGIGTAAVRSWRAGCCTFWRCVPPRHLHPLAGSCASCFKKQYNV
jgi:hypothetical protein